MGVSSFMYGLELGSKLFVLFCFIQLMYVALFVSFYIFSQELIFPFLGHILSGSYSLQQNHSHFWVYISKPIESNLCLDLLSRRYLLHAPQEDSLIAVALSMAP